MYPNYGNFFYNLSGKGIFTGKGIYRLDRFYHKLGGKLPQGKVLSHDILEGSLLETGASGISVYEDAPLNFVSEASRYNRWQRGDIQLLPFIAAKKPNTKHQIDILSTTIIFKNAFSVGDLV